MEVSASKTNGLVDAAAGSKGKANASLATFASAAASFTSMVQNVGSKMQRQGVSPDIERANSDTVSRDTRDYDEPQAREPQAVDNEPRQDNDDAMRDEPREAPRTETAPNHDAARDDGARRDAAEAGHQPANDSGDDHQSDAAASAPEQTTEQASDGTQHSDGTSQAENAQNAQAQAQTMAAAPGMLTEAATTNTSGGRIAPVEAVIQSLQQGATPTAALDTVKTAGDKTALVPQAVQKAVAGKGDEAHAKAQTPDGLLDNMADKNGKKASGQGTAQAANSPAKAATAQGAAPQAQTAADAQTPAQVQASQLARTLNDPKARMQVNVTVNNEAETLTSKPSAALTAIMPDTAKGPKTAATAAAAKNTHTLGQANTQHAGTAQQAALPAQMQAQAAATGNAQAATTSAASAQAVASTAGGEGISSSQGASPSGPAQQAQLPQQAAQAQRPTTPQQAVQQRAVVDQVRVQISKAVNAGADKISIQLKPAELGRINVQLEIQDGRITATVVADSKDTLEMLRNGSRDLAKSLSSAGFQTDSQDLNFSLREHGNQNSAQGGKGNDGSVDFNEAALGADADEAGDMDAGPAPTNIITDGRVDIRA